MQYFSVFYDPCTLKSITPVLLKAGYYTKKVLIFQTLQSITERTSRGGSRNPKHEEGVLSVTKTSILEVTEVLGKSLTPFYQGISQRLFFNSSCDSVVNK